MKKSLRESVESFGQAWAQRDLSTLRSLLAPDYIHTDFEGKVFSREEWLTYAGEQTHGATVKFRDMEYREYGSIALVLGANEIKGGNLGTAVIRFTQVWQSTDAGWIRLAFQATVAR